MSTEEDRVIKWWEAIKHSNLKGALGRVGSWDDLVQMDQMSITKAYQSACKINELSQDRSGLVFIGKIPDDHSVEFIVRSDRSAALKATPDDGGNPKYYELGGGFNWQDIKEVANIGQPAIVSRRYQGRNNRKMGKR